MSEPQSGGVEDVGHVLLEEALAAGVAGVELDHVVAQLLQAISIFILRLLLLPNNKVISLFSFPSFTSL